MAEYVKTILVFVLAFSLCIVSISVAYSMLTRGSAEFRFYYQTQIQPASHSTEIGFNCWGYHIVVFNEKGK